MGDEDGVENGVIVDPTGLAYVDSTTSDGASLSTGGTSTGSSGGNYCFISAGIQEMGWFDSTCSSATLLMVMTLLIAGISFSVAFQFSKNQ